MNIPEFYFAPCFINDDLLIAVYSRQTEGEWCDLSRHGQISFFIGASIVVTSKYILTRRGMSINYNVFTTGGKNHPEAFRYHWKDGTGYTQTAAQRREGCQRSPVYPAEDSSVQVRASDYQDITQDIFSHTRYCLPAVSFEIVLIRTVKAGMQSDLWPWSIEKI